MQDSFARARTRPNAAARPSARATIGYLVYNIICNTLNRYFCDMVMRKFQKPAFSGCPMPYLGPYHFPLFKGSPQMLSTGSNRFERWQGNSDIIASAFLFVAIICRIKIHFLVIVTSSDSVSISVISQDG